MKLLFLKEFITIFGLSFTPSQVQLFFVEFDWPITKRKVETMEAPQRRTSYGKMECLPFGAHI
jgi:hypothetical protein